ncbi:hypothetical protein B296_00058731, partial [Ensete ventricosum]
MRTVRYRAVPPKSTVDDRFRPSAVDFVRRRSISGEKGKKKKKKKKKKKRKRRKKRRRRKNTPCRPHPRVVALALGSLMSRRRPRLGIFSCWEKDRGD